MAKYVQLKDLKTGEDIYPITRGGSGVGNLDFEDIGTGDVPPVEIAQGGTGATTSEEARQNLGFLYGDEMPTEAPETGEGTVFFLSGDEGDVPCVSMELLWENQDPGDDFPAQTIELDLSGYDFVEIEWAMNKNSTSTVVYRYIKPMENHNACMISNAQNTSSSVGIPSRQIAVTDNGVVFGSGGSKYTNDNTSFANNDMYMIPHRIYGIKMAGSPSYSGGGSFNGNVVIGGGDTTELLWRNDDPTAEFPKQTISTDLNGQPLDLSGYDEVLIECTYSTVYTQYNYNVRCEIGERTSVDLMGGLSSGTNIDFIQRYFTVNSNGILVQDATIKTSVTGSAVVSNNRLVPIRIYGIKHADPTESATVPIEAGGTGASTPEEALANLGGINMELIWENADVASEFLPQNLAIKRNEETLNLSQYDELEIVFINSTIEYRQVRVRTKVGGSARAMMFADWDYAGPLYGQSRSLYVYEGYIKFTNGVKKAVNSTTNSIVDNTRMVPYKVFGIKGVK